MRPLDGHCRVSELDAARTELDVPAFADVPCCMVKVLVAFWRILHLLEARLTMPHPTAPFQIDVGSPDPVLGGRHLFCVACPLVLCTECFGPFQRLLEVTRTTLRAEGPFYFRNDTLSLNVAEVDRLQHGDVMAMTAIFLTSICVTQITNASATYVSAQFGSHQLTQRLVLPRYQALMHAIRRFVRHEISHEVRTISLVARREMGLSVRVLVRKFRLMLLADAPGQRTPGAAYLDCEGEMRGELGNRREQARQPGRGRRIFARGRPGAESRTASRAAVEAMRLRGGCADDDLSDYDQGVASVDSGIGDMEGEGAAAQISPEMPLLSPQDVNAQSPPPENAQPPVLQPLSPVQVDAAPASTFEEQFDVYNRQFFEDFRDDFERMRLQELKVLEAYAAENPGHVNDPEYMALYHTLTCPLTPPTNYGLSVDELAAADPGLSRVLDFSAPRAEQSDDGAVGCTQSEEDVVVD